MRRARDRPASDFRHNRLAAAKPANTVMIFCLGGSTVFGDPYPPKFAFPAWLEVLLRARCPSKQVEVVNCAVRGIDSRGVLLAFQELIEYEPDAVVVYTGHNEFVPENRLYVRSRLNRAVACKAQRILCHLRVFAAVKRVLPRRIPHLTEEAERAFKGPKGLIAEPIVTDQERGMAMRLFRQNIGSIAAIARKAGTPLVLCKVARSLRSYEPDVSCHTEGLAASEKAKWTRQFLLGRRLERAGYCQDAIRAYKAAEAADSLVAESHFRLGRCFDAAGRYDEARAEYRRACDLDGEPSRAFTAFNAWIEQASAPGVWVADVEKEFESASHHGLIGEELIFDSCHLRPKGNQIACEAVCRALARAGVVRLPSSQGGSPMQTIDYEAQLGLTKADHARGLKRAGFAMVYRSKLRHDPRVRLNVAARYFREALGLVPNHARAIGPWHCAQGVGAGSASRGDVREGPRCRSGSAEKPAPANPPFSNRRQSPVSGQGCRGTMKSLLREKP